MLQLEEILSRAFNGSLILLIKKKNVCQSENLGCATFVTKLSVFMLDKFSCRKQTEFKIIFVIVWIYLYALSRNTVLDSCPLLGFIPD